MSGHRQVRIAAVALAASALLGVAPGLAQAQRPASLGEGAPVGQSGIQLYNFSSYLSNGAGEILCPPSPEPATPYCVGPLAPTTTMARMERLFAFLQSRNVKNVELYSYPGHPFPSGQNPTGNPQGALELRALGDQYGIRFPGRHGSLNEARWDAEITIAKILGQDHVGESGPGGAGGVTSSLQQTIATAQQLNKLGKRSVEMGLGPAYFHNHANEFGTRFADNGVLKSGWEIVMDRTDPRWVVAQIDIGWAVCGGSGHVVPHDPGVGADYVNAMIQKFGSRVISFHVKDMAADGIRPNCGNPEQRTLGQGVVNFAPMLAAAKNKTKYYFAERDPVAIGGPTNFNPFHNTADSAVALKGDPAPTLKASPMLLSSVPAGTAAAANQKPMVVTNDGDAPLVISNANNAIQIQADANDGGTATAADFGVVSEDCRGKTIAPGSTCTINVGFKPTRTNYVSVARVVINANGDDAMERILVAGSSTGEATVTPGGTVPTMLGLSLPAQNASFGTFQPGIGRSYETAVAGSVTSTAGDATLSVSDPSTTAPGHLTNGAFALPQPLNVRAGNAANPANAFVALAEAASTQTNLLSYTGPVNGDVVTIGFRQAIGAGDVLRAGTYNKTLTFSLGTTTP